MTLTQAAFDKLLLPIGDDRYTRGKKYLEIYSNLTVSSNGAALAFGF